MLVLIWGSFPDSASTLEATDTGFSTYWNNAWEDPEINAACQERADQLAAGGALSHTDSFGRAPAEQMLSLGFDAGEWAEILGAGPDWKALLTGWNNSPSHRDVLETHGWVRFGWGQAMVGTTLVAVVRFWRP